MAEQHSEKKMSRRRFIRNSGYVAGGLVGGGIIGGLIGANMNDEQEGTNTQGEHQGTSFLQAPLYFTNPEMFAVLVAASERIFPSDDNGPGADELGVAYYIDHSLAGSWGTMLVNICKDLSFQDLTSKVINPLLRDMKYLIQV